MSKKNSRRRHLKGGFLDSLGQTFSNWGNSMSQGASSLWNKTKKASGIDGNSSSYTPSSSYSSSTSSSYTPSTTTTSSYSYGGRRRKTRRIRKIKRGGYGSNSSLTNLASTAAPFSGQTAKAHNWVGGKKYKRRRHKSRR